jgi:adenylate cyclase
VRRLTAILSADVVGYSGLMEADEAGTLERLKVNRSRIFDPCVAAQGGRVVKLMGDGALVEFGSVVAAVNCALAIQEATARAEPDRAEAKRIRYRIGINLGDVIVEGDDIYGEGVNVAARLQALAPVGGIAVSLTVRDHVVGKVPCAFEDLGEHTVKYIERPVRFFAVHSVDPNEG